MAGLRKPYQLRPAMAQISACRKISADHLTNPKDTTNINFDLCEHCRSGRHHIGTLAGLKSVQVAGFISECMAG